MNQVIDINHFFSLVVVGYFFSFFNPVVCMLAAQATSAPYHRPN